MSKILKSGFVDLKESARVLNYQLETLKIINDIPEEFESESNQIIKRVSIEDHTRQADLIVETAQLEAKQIIEDAQQQIEVEKDEIYNQTYQMAYEAGYKAGVDQAHDIIEEANQEKQNVIELKSKLYRDVEIEVSQIIIDLVNKLVGKAALNPQLIIHLIRMGFNEVEAIEQMVIHVCSDDYEHILKNMEKIYDFMDQKTKVEFFRNNAFSRGTCIIETPYGNVESSLGIQLKNLLADLELIKESYKKQ